MKKVLKICFEILFCFVIYYTILGLTSNVYAGVSVSGGSVNEGETITVNFSVTDNCGGFSGNVSYDTGKLEYVSSSVSGTGSYNNGSVAIVGGDSFSVTFRAKASGSASVSLGNIMLGDGSNVSGSSTSVTINSNAPATPEPAVATPVEDNSSNEPASSTAQVSAPEPESEPEFRSVNETVYATKSINVRSSWSTGSSKIGGLNANQAVTRTGIGDNGWSRISYNGKTAYVSSSLITTTEPTETEKTEEVIEEEKTEEVVEEIVENGAVEKTDEEIYQEIVSNIGTIPEVGNNYNIYVFLGICIMAIFSIMWLLKKI